ncbi:sodium:proton antiporter [Helicobacter monodelphidis]|uniref:Na+/H+ antiporter family protein n=1 Tax=Helicobacter sp. 15-1451 TaxID=2004995 RepID=UPI000DCB12EE|nr:Na+/H+ antiporter NhaC family protein [Helicobacter sp. 15-1451]RAX57930.1 sodium:proton antiporter [Helicobacter sp. 15-1451]
MALLSNAVIVSVAVMAILCLLRLNVLLAIIIATLCAGIISQYGQHSMQEMAQSLDAVTLLKESIQNTIQIFIEGMSGNLETALSYILLGSLAVAVSRTHLTIFLLNAITKVISNHRIILLFSIALIACFSQNLIPIHIAFIPILIPPLLGLFNRLKIDRRAVACALTFGLKAPYVTIGVGFGYIFHTTIKKQMEENGVNVSLGDIGNVMWIGGLAMLVGLILAVLVFYRKDRIYAENAESFQVQDASMGYKEWVTLLGLVVAIVVQLQFESLPLGAFLGLMTIILLKGIAWNEIDDIMEGGLKMMAFIAFVMLVAAGYGKVLNAGGDVESLVNMIKLVVNGQFAGAVLMLFVGLLVTMGIGTSFGTIPIITTIYLPLGLALGFSIPSIILLIGIAGALGDAGSPASDSTLGPTSGLNADGQHNHIWDTCIPTFVAYNIPLFIFGVIGALQLS